MGIDPGTSILGYGVIRVEDKKMTLLAMDVVRMDKISDHALKLEKIFTRCVEIIEEYHPDELSIEAPFFGKNVQSMLKLGRAQGVAIAAALSHKLTVVEYAPRTKTMIINTTTKRANNHILYLMRDKKIIKPRICQILLTGFTTVKRSMIILFQIHLPMKLMMIIAIKKATMVEIISR